MADELNHPPPNRRPGMRSFSIIWFGQLVSMLGTGMSNFALSYWIYQETGEASALTWAIFAFIAPSILFSPVAGALVDRYDRKTIMIISDLAAGITTIWILFFLLNGRLDLWQIYAANVVAGIFNAFQFPAYSAAITLLLPKEQYTRASGMISMAGSGSQILAPVLAGALLAPLGLEGILIIDIVTFVFAIGTLMVIHIPKPKMSEDGRSGNGSLWQESLFGFRYIWRRPSLLGLQSVFFFLNFMAMFSFALLVPLILERTNNSAAMLATVQTIGAVGGLIGGLLLTVWGGPKRKVHGVLLGMVGGSLLGQTLMGVGQSLAIWLVAAFCVNFFLPIINGSNQAIWQAKVAPDVQGRVFSVRRLIAQITAPLATAVAGPLADKFFTPAMSEGGALVDAFSWLVGTGPGAGIALMFVFSGLLGAAVALVAYTIPAIRNAEAILPDYDEKMETAVVQVAA